MQGERIWRNDLAAGYRRLRGPLDAAIARVLASGRYVLGEELAAFEREFASWLGCHQVVGVANGTDALALALRVAGLRPGDEVVVPAFGPTPTPAAVLQAGGTPVFVDVEPDSGLLDPERLEAAVGPRTRFVIPVHLFGRVCAMAAIGDVARKRGLEIVEDAAQAHGSERDGRRAGTFADLAAFSFYPTKNLGAIGDGGAVAVGRDDLGDALAQLRNYGKVDGDPFDSRTVGVNSRLDELQAAILRVRLADLEAANAARARLADRYREGFLGLPLRRLGESVPGRTNDHVFTVDVGDHRDDLRRVLESHNVQTHVYYPTSLPGMPAYRPFAGEACFTTAEALTRRVLALPMYPELSLTAVDRVVGVVREYYGR